VAIIALMGKLELPPLDAPEAETEIVAGALSEEVQQAVDQMVEVLAHIDQ
jgi:hypothetical protein